MLLPNPRHVLQTNRPEHFGTSPPKRNLATTSQKVCHSLPSLMWHLNPNFFASPFFKMFCHVTPEIICNQPPKMFLSYDPQFVLPHHTQNILPCHTQKIFCHSTSQNFFPSLPFKKFCHPTHKIFCYITSQNILATHHEEYFATH